MAEPPADVTSEFFRGELERALQENGFAIMAWEVMDDAKSENYGSPAHAEATVELLPEQEEMGDKGHSVTIRVTLQGYSVITDQEEGKNFETLDDLLSAYSPAYARRRHKLLFAKLEEVAQARSWDEPDTSIQDEH